MGYKNEQIGFIEANHVDDVLFPAVPNEPKSGCIRGSMCPLANRVMRPCPV